MIEQELINELNSFCEYNPETGELTAIKRRIGTACTKGKVVGNLDGKYLRTQIKGSKYLVHRLIWLLHYGSWPTKQIDHLNGNTLDNRLENLRDVTQTVNMRNTKLNNNNSSGIIGVYLNTQINKWIAQICVNSKVIYLGCFENFNEAVTARELAEEKYGFSKRHGQ